MAGGYNQFQLIRICTEVFAKIQAHVANSDGQVGQPPPDLLKFN